MQADMGFRDLSLCMAGRLDHLMAGAYVCGTDNKRRSARYTRMDLLMNNMQDFYMKRTALIIMCAMNAMALFSQPLYSKSPKVEKLTMGDLVRADLVFAAAQYKVLMN